MGEGDRVQFIIEPARVAADARENIGIVRCRSSSWIA